MQRSKQRQSPYFRWNALEWAQHASAGVVALAAVAVVGLVIYSAAASAEPGSTGQPHLPAPLAILPRPAPTPSPMPRPTVVPSPTPYVPRIGIVAGHRGNDPGTVCSDGLTEASITSDTADRVAYELRRRGYKVDLLDEFDARLSGYRALALVSIHADSCEYVNDQATGFKVASVMDSKAPEEEKRLVQCLTDKYGARTGLKFHANTITFDMTRYHAFYEIAPETPAAIIEIGFMRLDRQVLTQRIDLVAQGIIDGIMCYLTFRGNP